MTRLPAANRVGRATFTAPLSALVLLVLVACADPPGPASRERTGGEGNQATEPSARPGRIVIGFAHTDTVSFPTEGQVSFVELTRAGGEAVAAVAIRPSEPLTRPVIRRAVPAGTYRLEGYQRACVGTCPGSGTGGLDPPSGQCAAIARVPRGETVVATVRLVIGQGCSITLERPGGETPVGEPRPHRLLTHCGVLFARFDGRDWEAAPPLVENGNPPTGWANPVEEGTMTLLSEGVAEFRAGPGRAARFVPLGPTTEIRPCH